MKIVKVANLPNNLFPVYRIPKLSVINIEEKNFYRIENCMNTMKIGGASYDESSTARYKGLQDHSFSRWDTFLVDLVLIIIAINIIGNKVTQNYKKTSTFGDRTVDGL